MSFKHGVKETDVGQTNNIQNLHILEHVRKTTTDNIHDSTLQLLTKPVTMLTAFIPQPTSGKLLHNLLLKQYAP